MTNFILLLGFAVGVAGLVALALGAGIQWLSRNPAILIATLIGAAIATVITIKIKNEQDEALVKSYRRRQRRQEPDLEPIARPVKQAHPVASKQDNDDLLGALVGLGYSRTEAKEAVKIVNEESPNSSLQEKIVMGIGLLSPDKAAK